MSDFVGFIDAFVEAVVTHHAPCVRECTVCYPVDELDESRKE
jgi:hypothetical protein